MAKVGRKTLLNEDVHKRIVDTITGGNYLDTAAAVAGISSSTLHAWLDRGRKARDLAALGGKEAPADERPFVSFLEDVEKARATAEARAVLLIQRAAQDGTWQAAAWYLERSAPKRWGRQDRMLHSNPEGGPVEVMVSSEELEQKVQALIAQRGTQESE